VSLIDRLPREFQEVLRPGKLAVALTIIILVGVAYWYLGSPGPRLLQNAEPGFHAAAFKIGLAAALMLVVPLIATFALGMKPSELGLRLGDARYGLLATVIVTSILVVPLFFAADDPLIQDTYPWAGHWPGQSVKNLAMWIGMLLIYYVSFEYFFRGFMIKAIEPHWGLAAAIWAQAIASTLVHLGKPPAETITALPAGILFGIMAVRGRSILWPALLHLNVGLITDLSSLWRQGQLLSS
jgi:membrane protease YdiL (CAAX protease family)